ncbi:MAG TPA: glycosyltransferase 87 family protein [Solirubrobacteraceae bacterium]|nr:glycosyltransferase 87 family protein [Solirubrobacteraceae bacterium]
MSVQTPLGATPQSGAIDLQPGLLRDRVASSRARVGAIGVAGVLICGFVIVLAASGTTAFLPESVRPVPSSLAGALGNTGIDLHVVGVLLVLGTMFGCYALAVHRCDELSPRTVMTAIVALNAVVLLGPPLLSTDVFSYEIYARMGTLYSANPYLHGPHAIALDPLYSYIDSKWVYTPTTYGPLFTALSYLLTPLSIAAGALAYRAIAVLSSLGCVALIWRGAKLRGVNPSRAAVLFGLNPLVVMYGVGGGHNDLLMLLLVVAGLVATLEYRERSGAGLIVLGAAVKLTGALLLPFALARSWAHNEGRRRFDSLAGAAIATVAVAALSFGLFGTGVLQLPGTIQTVQQEGDWHSIPGFISTRLGLGGLGHATGLVLAFAFAVALCILVWRVATDRLDWIEGAAWATAAMLITASSLLPWYVAWMLPLIGLSKDRRLWRAAIIITGVIQAIQLLGYIPHGSTFL